MRILILVCLGLVLMVSFNGCPVPVNSNSIIIYNNSSVWINAVYVSPSSSNSWGVNQIYYSLQPGDSVTIYNIPNNYYDLLVEGDYGLYWRVDGISLYNGAVYITSLYDKKQAEILQSIDNEPTTYDAPYTSETSDFKKLK